MRAPGQESLAKMPPAAIVASLSTADGKILWDFNTAEEFATVNGVKGKGGSLDGPGPVVAGGMVCVNSGYGMFRGMPGNLLLALHVQADH